MIDEITLKKAVNAVVKQAWPKAHHYGNGIVEGWKEPAVFTEMKLTNQEDATINIVEKQYLVTVEYYAKTPSEEDSLKHLTALKKALQCIDDRNRKRKMCIKVEVEDEDEPRYIRVTGLSYEYIGDDYNILRIRFNLNFYDTEEIDDPEPLMEHVELDEKPSFTERVRRHFTTKK